MSIVLITSDNKQKLNQFLEKHSLGSIQQSFFWTQVVNFDVPVKNNTWLIAVLDDQKQVQASALIVKRPFPFNKCWLWIPRGPVVDFKTSAWNELWTEIKKIAKKERAIFVRIEPPFKQNQSLELERLLPEFKIAAESYQPQTTIKLDLSLTEDQLLNRMKPKGRYNINLARKKGVKIETFPQNDVKTVYPSSVETHCNASLPKIAKDRRQLPSAIEKEKDQEAVKAFYNLIKETTKRDGFSPHAEAYYQNFLEVLGKENSAKLYLAKFADKYIAGILVTFFGPEATYYYGASGSEYRNLMAPYLLQWTAILDAKKCGFKKYDLFGIAPLDAKNHPWAGVTEFKLKFGGEVYEYTKPLEYVFKPWWYFGIKMAKRMLKMLK